MVCPHCQSVSIHRNEAESAGWRGLFLVAGHCRTCCQEFNVPFWQKLPARRVETKPRLGQSGHKLAHHAN